VFSDFVDACLSIARAWCSNSWCDAIWVRCIKRLGECARLSAPARPVFFVMWRIIEGSFLTSSLRNRGPRRILTSCRGVLVLVDLARGQAYFCAAFGPVRRAQASIFGGLLALPLTLRAESLTPLSCRVRSSAGRLWPWVVSCNLIRFCTLDPWSLVQRRAFACALRCLLVVDFWPT